MLNDKIIFLEKQISEIESSNRDLSNEILFVKKEKTSIEKINNDLKFELDKLDNNLKNLRKKNAEMKIKMREDLSSSFHKETEGKIQNKMNDLEKINLKSLLETYKSK